MKLTRSKSFLLAAAGLSALVLTACGPAQHEEELGDEPHATAPGDWITLSEDGDLSQWRGFRREDLPSSWRIENGVLAFVPSEDADQRGDIITRERFADFELELEWRIAEGGNSGVMYRVREDQQATWHTGPEMQVLDDERHPDGRIPSHRAGALYDLVVPPEGITRPIGEWNQVLISVRGTRIQQWLNGHLTANVEIGSEEWDRMIAASKFDGMSGFGTQPDGHIALQDHGDPVWFRNVRIRPLD